MSLARKVRGRGKWRIATIIAVLIAGLHPMPSASAVPHVPEPRQTLREPRMLWAQATKEPSKKEPKKKPRDRSIKDMIRDEFGKHSKQALRVAYCESRLQPRDVSYAGAVGVFQIRPSAHGWRLKEVKKAKDLFDPQTNVRVARHIFKDQGWGPWVCARMLGLTSGRRSVRRSITPDPARDRTPRVPRVPGDGSMI